MLHNKTYPGNVTLSHIPGTALGASTLSLSWSLPLRDGGATIEKYRLQYSAYPAVYTSLSGASYNDIYGVLYNGFLEEYNVIDYPVVAEVQVVVVESPVVVEVQSVLATVAVTNEVQVIRTQVNGTDEVQTVTITCDDVTNEIQRFTTTATDVNEVQSLEVVGTAVREVQLLRTSTYDVPTIQSVSISSPLVNEVQIIGVIIENIAISCPAPGTPPGVSTCPAVESNFGGTFSLSFDPNTCGTDPSDPDSNWCVEALKEEGITGYDCSSSTNCVSAQMPLGSGTTGAAAIQTAICNLHGSSSAKFMTDSNSKFTHIKNYKHIRMSSHVCMYMCGSRSSKKTRHIVTIFCNLMTCGLHHTTLYYFVMLHNILLITFY